MNLVANEFDRKLGIEIVEAPPSPEGIRHARAKLPDGFLLEIDNGTLARFYNAAWREVQERERVVIGFRLPTRDEVDRRYNDCCLPDTLVSSRPTTLSGDNGMRSSPTPTGATSVS